MPAATPDRSTEPGAGGLRTQLEQVQAHLRDLLGVPCLIGDPTGSDQEAGDHAQYVLIHTIRTVVPPYLAGQQVSRITAHVLVEAFGADHAANGEAIATAMLHLLADSRWELVPNEPDLALWAAVGRPPGPAFVLAIPLTLPIHRPQAPPVRGPLDMRDAGIRRVGGRVLAADGTPLAGARVRLRPNGMPTVAGHDGRWRLSVPTIPVELDVSAHGVRTTFALDATAGSAAGLNLDIVLAELGADGPPERPRPAQPQPTTHQETEN